MPTADRIADASGWAQRPDGTWRRKSELFAPQMFEVHYRASEVFAEEFGNLKPHDIFRKTRVLRNDPPRDGKDGLLIVECGREHADEFTRFLLDLDKKAAANEPPAS